MLSAMTIVQNNIRPSIHWYIFYSKIVGLNFNEVVEGKKLWRTIVTAWHPILCLLDNHNSSFHSSWNCQTLYITFHVLEKVSLQFFASVKVTDKLISYL